MEQITREEMIELIDKASGLLCFYGEDKTSLELDEATAALQAAEPVGIVVDNCGKNFVNWRGETPWLDSAKPGTELFTLPCPPANASHWSANNPGRADQYMGEALAARRALGFSEDAEDVAPIDITNAIVELRQPATELAPESWREELETIAEILEADGDEWNCAARIRKMLTASPAPERAEAETSNPRRSGYAGVTVWVGDRQVTQIVSQTELVSSNADELLRRFENARHLLTASPAPAHIPGAGEMIDGHIGDGNEMVSALRQYRHNDDSGFVFAYDKEQTDRIVTGLVEALEQIAESRDVGRYDGKPEDGPMLTDTEMWLIAQEALNTYLQQEEAER